MSRGTTTASSTRTSGPRRGVEMERILVVCDGCGKKGGCNLTGKDGEVDELKKWILDIQVSQPGHSVTTSAEDIFGYSRDYHVERSTKWRLHLCEDCRAEVWPDGADSDELCVPVLMRKLWGVGV